MKFNVPFLGTKQILFLFLGFRKIWEALEFVPLSLCLSFHLPVLPILVRKHVQLWHDNSNSFRRAAFKFSIEKNALKHEDEANRFWDQILSFCMLISFPFNIVKGDNLIRMLYVLCISDKIWILIVCSVFKFLFYEK